MTNLEEVIIQIATDAKKASFMLASMDTHEKNAVLLDIAKSIDKERDFIKTQNFLDQQEAKEADLPKALINRLLLNDTIIDSMIKNINDVANMPDPIGKTITDKILTNNIKLKKIRVPIGVISIIFESRPNVITDIAALCIKSSNAVIMRGGSEAKHSNLAIMSVIEQVLQRHLGFLNTVQMIKITNKEAVTILCKQDKYIDLIIPRGGEGLINAVKSSATIPVLKNYKGICHIYIDENADVVMALNICYNAKCQRAAVCNAVETILVHKNISEKFLPLLYKKFTDAQVQMRGDEQTLKILPNIQEACEKDWSTEYLDLIVSIKIINDSNEAINHINHFGSHHSDAIITSNKSAQNLFCRLVDSAVVYVNASTRFSDGSVFGLGGEIGISTDKLHARGPVGLNEITTYKWIALGDGQVRE